MFNSKLEIIILTYNRSKSFISTLNYVHNSILSNCKITVLDNCSNDDTYSEFKLLPYYKKINYIVNNTNIGPCLNFLKAIEMSEFEYTWILCDDDICNFNNLLDLVEVINKSEVDLIHVGAHKESWTFGGTYFTPSKSIESGYHFFKYGSFWPCNIYRTSLLKENLNNIKNAVETGYPQMPVLMFAYNKKLNFYISKNQLIFANVYSENYNYNTWLIYWIKACSLFKEKKLVRIAFFDHFYTENLNSVICSLKRVSEEDLNSKLVVKNFIKNYFTLTEKVLFSNSYQKFKLILKNLISVFS
jgi:glycosyltransferase involved in cell wall biosynthesis